MLPNLALSPTPHQSPSQASLRFLESEDLVQKSGMESGWEKASLGMARPMWRAPHAEGKASDLDWGLTFWVLRNLSPTVVGKVLASPHLLLLPLSSFSYVAGNGDDIFALLWCVFRASTFCGSR